MLYGHTKVSVTCHSRPICKIRSCGVQIAQVLGCVQRYPICIIPLVNRVLKQPRQCLRINRARSVWVNSPLCMCAKTPSLLYAEPTVMTYRGIVSRRSLLGSFAEFPFYFLALFILLHQDFRALSLKFKSTTLYEASFDELNQPRYSTHTYIHCHQNSFILSDSCCLFLLFYCLP